MVSFWNNKWSDALSIYMIFINVNRLQSFLCCFLCVIFSHIYCCTGPVNLQLGYKEQLYNIFIVPVKAEMCLGAKTHADFAQTSEGGFSGNTAGFMLLVLSVCRFKIGHTYGPVSDSFRHFWTHFQLQTGLSLLSHRMR